MLFKWIAEQREKRQKAHLQRLTDLIKQAPTNEPLELAKFLIKNGVCDKQEVDYLINLYSD